MTRAIRRPRWSPAPGSRSRWSSSGATAAALTVAIATALGWALWHNWPRLSRLWQMKQSLGGRYAAARRTNRVGERPTVLIRAPAGHVDAPIPAP